MGLSTRELLLVIRARDEASRVMNRISNNLSISSRRQIMDSHTAARRSIEDANIATQTKRALLRQETRDFQDTMAQQERSYNKLAQKMSAGHGLMSLGATMIAVSAIGVAAFDSMADASTAYNQDAATSFTQVEDKATDSLAHIKQMGLETAQKFAVSFEQIQPAIYDIFSSVEDKGEDARLILEGIARAAVGGATDMGTASNSIIGILNAWNLKAKDVSTVNDQMFQLVRKGRGTFQQFTAAMGKAIPSAKNAGQSVEEVSAALMLLTRNGVTTAMSGTSVARAMDLMANPQFQTNMKAAGMSVYDAAGKMKPMSQIIEEIRNKFKDLNPEQRANQLKGLLGGAGNNIQARRFLNLALGDTNKQYKQMLIYAKNAGGAADEAYNIMSNTPQAKLQAMANEIEVFKVTFGEALTNVKVFIAEAITPLLKWFNSLDPTVKNAIITFSLVGIGIGILAGIIIGVIGAVMLFTGSLVAMEIALAPIIIGVLAVIAAIALLAGAGILIYQNWGSITDWWSGVWDEMQRVIEPFVDQIKSRMKDLAAGWDWFMKAVGPALEALGGALENLMSNIGPIFNWIVGAILSWLVPAWQILSTVVGNILGGIGSILGGFINVLAGVINFIVALFTGNWAALWTATQQIFSGLVQMIVGVFQTLGGLLWGILWGVINGVIGFFTYLWDVLVGHSIIPDMILAIVDWFWKLPGRIFTIVSNFVSGVVRFISELPGKAIAAIAPFAKGIITKATEAWSGFKEAVSTGISNAISLVKELPGKIKGALSGAIGWLKGVGENLVQGLINGIRAMWDNAVGWITRLGQGVVDAAKRAFDQHSPSRKFFAMGVNNMQGLINGTMSMRAAVDAAYEGLTTVGQDGSGNLTFGLYSRNNASSSDVGGPRKPGNGSDAPIAITVNTQEIDPVKHSADLGYELAARLNL